MQVEISRSEVHGKMEAVMVVVRAFDEDARRGEIAEATIYATKENPAPRIKLKVSLFSDGGFSQPEWELFLEYIAEGWDQFRKHYTGVCAAWAS